MDNIRAIPLWRKYYEPFNVAAFWRPRPELSEFGMRIERGALELERTSPIQASSFLVLNCKMGL